MTRWEGPRIMVGAPLAGALGWVPWEGWTALETQFNVPHSLYLSAFLVMDVLYHVPMVLLKRENSSFRLSPSEKECLTITGPFLSCSCLDCLEDLDFTEMALASLDHQLFSKDRLSGSNSNRSATDGAR
jgi:hypothetical protein